MLAGARLGVKLTPKNAKRYQDRIDELVHDLANEDDEPNGLRFGFYVTWHRL